MAFLSFQKIPTMPIVKLSKEKLDTLTSDKSTPIRGPSGHKGSDEQVAIWEAINKGKSHLIIQARAGTGKTTTITDAVWKLPTKLRESTGIVAFNKPIANELSRRVPEEVFTGTSHQLGRRYLVSAYPESQFNPGKVSVIAKGVIGEARSSYPIRIACEELVRLLKNLYLTQASPNVLEELLDHYSISIRPEHKTDVLDYVPTIYTDSMDISEVHDFDDMIWSPVYHNLVKTDYDLLMVDESQDLNRSQQELVLRAGKRLVLIGDDRQCQPADTLVSMEGGSKKRIQDIKIGDKVVTYNRTGNNFAGIRTQGRTVLDIASRKYSGKLYTVRCDGGRSTQCTSSHRWIVRYVDRKDSSLWCVYLMRQGDRFKVGWCQMFDRSGASHYAQRARIERADCLWVLSIHRSKTDASIEESRVATVYGLPLFPLNQVDVALHLTKEAIDKFYNSLPARDMLERATKCLKEHNRSVKYPLWTRKSRLGRQTIFETQACNLLSGIMMVPIYNKKTEVEWDSITVSTGGGVKDMEVWSLDVENETYIANGIATHNSIYAFRGADAESMPRMQRLLDNTKRGCITLPLTISRRCPKIGISLAQQLVPDIQARPDAPEGTIETATEDITKLANPGDLVLCRVNAPLLSTAYKLIRKGVRCQIQGRNIGQGIISLVRSLRAANLSDLSVKLSAWHIRESKRLLARNKSAQSVVGLDDKYECINQIIAEMSVAIVADKTPPDKEIDKLLTFLDGVFQDESFGDKPFVLLSSIHRAKGLEADTVHILDGILMPHPMAKKEWDRAQEENCMYVAFTRFKTTLYFHGGIPQGISLDNLLPMEGNNDTNSN